MKKSVLLQASLLFIFLSVASFGQVSDLKQPVPPDPAIRIGKLDNGLTYYVKANKKPEQRIELRLAINAGSVCETEGQLGLAHFVEHMCFNGTKNFPSNRIVEMLEEMGVKFGAELNAYTSFDQTIYMLKVPSDREEWINRGFQVLEDWAHQVSMEEAEIDKERGVIVEEWRLGLGAEDRMMQKYIPVLLKGSRYAERLPIGKVEVIKSFAYDTLRNFYKSWYRPDLMAVVVVGDIDPAVAENKVKEYFGRIPKAMNPPARVEYPVPGNAEPLISVVTDKEASGYSAVVFFKHPKSDKGTYGEYRKSVMRSLYTGMLISRLQEIGQEPEAPFLYAGATYSSFIGRTVDCYQLSMGAKENQIEKSLEIVLMENERARRHGFLASELEREKKDMLTMYEKMAKEADKTESGSYADEYIRNYMDEESIPGIQREFEIIKEFLPGISLDEINRLGQEFVSDKDIVAMVTAQEKEGVSVPTEAKVLEIIKSVKGMKIDPYAEKLSDAPLLAAVPAGTAVVKRKDNPAAAYTDITFANGVRIILKPTDFKNDEIILSAYSPGGNSLYPVSDVMSATLAPTIITQSGLGEFDMIGLQKKLSGNTAKLSPYINELREGVNGNCSPKDLETLLQLNYLYFTGTRRDESAFNAYLSRIRNMIKPMRSTPQVVFQDTLSKIISMNSPRVIAVPTDAQLDQIKLDRSMEIFRERFADASDFTYIMVGNFNIDEVLPMLEKYIGGLPSIKRKETWKDVSPGFPEGKVVVEVPRNSEPQSTVAMIWKDDFKWKLEERQAFSMLMQILNIKARESMREDQGGVYGVSINGSAAPWPKSEYTIQASWGCNPENIGKLASTVIAEMDTIKMQGPTVTDLNKVRETMIRERETRLKENSFWISALQNHLMYGDKLRTIEEYKAFINSFTATDIKAVANRYLDTMEYVQVALTPAPGVEKK